jgi:DNA-binding NarL/FixJ family response regulator
MAEQDDAPTLHIGSSDLDDVMYLMTQLMVQSGGQHQRSRRLGVAIQEIAGTGDRMRYLLRAWSEDSLDAGNVTRQLEEITADLGLAAKEMDQLRGEFDAVADGKDRIQAELSGSIARLRTVPLAVFLPDLERAAEYAARFGKRARFQAQGDQVELDLPAHGGLQVIRAARNLDDALVIGLQSRDDDESGQRARSLGVKSYLVKPVEPEQLLAAVRLATTPVSSNSRH